MTNARTYDDWFGQVPIDDRNEQPLVIALVAIVVGSLAVFVVSSPKQPTSACGAPLWMKMVAAPALAYAQCA